MNTQIRTNTKTEQILTVMYILTWLAFVGLMIQAGAILVSYGISWVNPEAAKYLYKGLDLDALRQLSLWHYTQSVSFVIALLVMKAYVLFLVIKTLSKVNLENPFTNEITRKLETISYVLFGTWFISLTNNAYAAWLSKSTSIVQGTSATEEFIFMAGLVFIISQIFKRGVELQSENDLTV